MSTSSKMNAQRGSTMLLIGQAPSRNGDPRRPLEGRMGANLAELFGCSDEEYISRTQRLNVLGEFCGKMKKGDRFPMRIARINAGRMQFSFDGCRVLFIGIATARAFCVDCTILRWRTHRIGDDGLIRFRYAVLPHPSGINRWWNDRENKTLARKFMRACWRKHVGIYQ